MYLPQFFLILTPIKAYAEDVAQIKQPETKGEHASNFLKSAFSGVAKCGDPSASTLEKFAACAAPCCYGSFVVTKILSSKCDISPKIKAGLNACCGISFMAYATLNCMEAKEKSKLK